MNYQVTQENIIELNHHIENWKSYFVFKLREDFANVVFDIRKNMMKEIAIPKLDILTYKKAIIHQIQEDYNNIREFHFTDDELLENRIKNTPAVKDMKITKLLSKQIAKQRRYASTDQRVDYFHKPADENREYFLTGNPITMARMYLDVDTCISPEGENQASIFQYLVSPYFYILYSSDFKNRMLVIIDEENKRISASRVYGSYDFMMSASFAKWCVDNGYTFADRNYFILDTDDIHYLDATDQGITSLVKYFGGDLIDNYSQRITVDPFQKPAHCTFVCDAITNKSPFNSYVCDNRTVFEKIHSSCSHIMDESTEYCPECGCLTHPEDFDHSEGMCADCSANHNYCEGCDHYYHEDEYNFEHSLCTDCAYEEYGTDEEEETD